MTREVVESLPQGIRDRIERFRKDMKTDPRHREIYICKGQGYIEGLRDAGLIKEVASKILKCYLTV
jgi:hypothetical protein